MNVAILGVDPASQTVANIIEGNYNPWLETKLAEPLNVVAYVAEGYGIPPALGDKAILNLYQFAALHYKGLVDRIIFPREIFFETQKGSLTQLRTLGVGMDKVFVAARLGGEIFLPNFLESFLTVRYLPHIEFHAADQCNLNCKTCEHYSGLVREPHFPNLEKFTRDFERLHELIDDFAAIRILGGEPLLNPEVSEFVKVCRRIYPVSPLHVVTNAILLNKMPDEFFDAVRECNALIWISFYPPMESKMPAIVQLLKEKRVQFWIGGKIENFFWRQSLKRNNNPAQMFALCGYSNCHNLCDGKIAACFLPFVTKYFNAYYGTNIPEDGALDLYEKDLTTEKLHARLLTPLERCNYCREGVALKWETVSHPSPITDWINE